jgi:UDP-N-acetylmuramoyl-L-alanyl-D-glutamate--2,6-diaminopimelate ligase
VKFRLDSTTFFCSLLGRFNLYNILGALAIVRAHKVDFVTIKEALSKVEGIPGRMEFIDEGQDFEVIVDFAHTPDSFQAVLETIKKAFFIVSGFKDCICVFGSAGGGRDQWKRPKLGEIASKYCDKIILTTDDPYKEDPKKIAADIKEGIDTGSTEVLEELDRREAIRRAFQLASEDDIVLLLGKGAEKILPIGGEKISWDDREVAREELEKLDAKSET